MIKYFKPLIIIVVGLFLFSCTLDLQEPELVIVETDYKESLLIVNGISGLSTDEGVTVFTNGSKLNETPVKYSTTSESYIDVKQGETEFSIKIGNEDVNVTGSLNIEAGKLYTLYLCGTKDNPGLVINEDIFELESIEHKHKMQLANLSPEFTEGLELEVYVRGYESVVENGFHSALGPYGVLTNYAGIKGLPQILKYKEISSVGFPPANLLIAFPYRFIKSGSNTAGLGNPIPQSIGEYFAGQAFADLAQGNFTNTTLFVKGAYTTTVVMGTSSNNDKKTFNYNNTELYNNK